MIVNCYMTSALRALRSKGHVIISASKIDDDEIVGGVGTESGKSVNSQTCQKN